MTYYDILNFYKFTTYVNTISIEDYFIMPIQEHFRILSALINLILGSYIAYYIYYRTSKLPYPYIKHIIRFIILFNLCIVIVLISKYVGLNLLNRISPNLIQRLIESMIVCIVLILCWMEYEIIQIILGLLEKKLTEKYKVWSIIGLVSILIYCFVEIVFLHNLKPIQFLSIFLLCIVIVDFIIQLGIIINGIIFQEKTRKKISIAFGLLFISRYLIPLVIYLVLRMVFIWDIPDTIAAIGAFIILLYYNFVPLLWFRFFFLPYAESLSNIVERSTSLDDFYEKYHITKREQDILRLILDGKSNAEIKKTLFISLHTVKNHIYNIYHKLNINTRYELILLITRLQENQ